MDRLNLFKPFDRKNMGHEDVLTRNFLLLLKNIPLVQIGFFELVRDTVSADGIFVESSARGILKLSEIYTQVDSNDSMFQKISDVNMLSIVISDDAYQSKENVSETSKRHARYDGVVICEPSWMFIIENKPSVHNIWHEQLSPNIEKMEGVTLIEKPCALSWRDVISMLNELLSGNSLTPFEATAISEFIEYVDEQYPRLNPYSRFELCKSNPYLLDRRCCAVMGAYKKGTVVKYHKGWKHYIDVGNEFVRMIALDSSVADTNVWSINLWMYAADIMSCARSSYRALDVEKLLALPKIDPNFTLDVNFHYSYRSSGLIWLSCPSTFEEYIRYWKSQPELRQIKREDFEAHFNKLVADGMASEADEAEFRSKILSKNYPNLNVCPGFLIKYSWPKSAATALDHNGRFEAAFREKVHKILDVFG